MTEEAKLIAKVETKGAKRASDELENFAKSADDADKSNESLQKTLKAGAAVFKASAAFIATTATAATALAVKSANAQREWNQLALTARDNVDNFKAAAFAAEQVGISAEKLSDISKDTLEKLGEFIATGGGGFKDFFEQVAPLVDLTAEELQGLSGPQVLGRVQSAMEQANVPMELQSFYLESIASDTTKLIPLLADESAELNRLANSYKEVNEQLALTSDQQVALQELSSSFNLLEESAANALTFLTTQFAPQLTQIINFWIESIPVATKSVSAFFDQFRDPENKQSIDAIQDEIAELADEFFKLREAEEGYIVNSKRYKEVEARLASLRQRYDELQQSQQTATLTAPVFANASTGSGDVINSPEANREKELLEYRKSLLREWQIAQEEAEQDYYDRLDERQMREREADAARLAGATQLFGSLTALTAAFGKESSNEAKALFAITQGLNIASAIQNIITAGSGAARDTPGGAGARLAAYSGLVSALLPAVSTMESAGNFANGGIVGGNSFTGDRMTANVNSGEMILNKQQQANLFAQANGAGSGGITIINETKGRIDSVNTSTDSDGRLRIRMQEFLNNQVEDPNSDFNKRMQVTRRTQPLLP